MKNYRIRIADDGTGMFCGNPCNVCMVKDFCQTDNSSKLDEDQDLDSLQQLCYECSSEEGLDYCIVEETKEELKENTNMEILTVISLGQLKALSKLFEQNKNALDAKEQKEIRDLQKDLSTNQNFEVAISGHSVGSSFGNIGTDKAIEYFKLIADECTSSAQYESLKIIQ